jgi:molybdate transport system regulatory protein
MAGPKGSKYYDVFLKFKVWLENTEGESILGNGKFELIDYIDQFGSLKAAADKMEISYRKAWGDIKRAEEGFGRPLVVKSRGGNSGGSTELTEFGQQLIKGWGKYRLEVKQHIDKAYDKHLKPFIENGK